MSERSTRIEQLFREAIRDFPLHTVDDEICTGDSGDMAWLAYGRDFFANDSVRHYLDLNFSSSVCWLLHLYLPKPARGQGHGRQLLRIVEDVAREAGCRQIWCTPSGWTPAGDDRAHWYARRGWELSDTQAYKDLL